MRPRPAQANLDELQVALGPQKVGAHQKRDEGGCYGRRDKVRKLAHFSHNIVCTRLQIQSESARVGFLQSRTHPNARAAPVDALRPCDKRDE